MKKSLASIIMAGALSLGIASEAKGNTIYSEDFESGDISRWVNSDPGWKVVDDNGNNVYRQDEIDEGGGRWKSTSLDFYAKNYRANVDVRILSAGPGSFGATLMMYKNTSGHFNINEPNLAFALFKRTELASLYVYEEGKPLREYSKGMQFDLDRWYNIGISVENGLATAWLDGEKLITDVPTTLTSGYVAFNVDGTRADFDNLMLTPEPISLEFLGMGLMGVGIMGRGRKAQHHSMIRAQI